MKLAIIGNFGNSGKNVADGQTIKTRIVANELIKQFGEESIITFNTCGGIKKIFSAPIMCIRALYGASNVIILPAQNGVRVFAPLLYLFSFLIRNRKLHYCVIGGWLPYFIKNKPFLTKSLKAFHSIYVETNTMKNDMEHMQFNNVVIMPNFKDVNILSKDDLVTQYDKPYRLCTFSRVMKEKGIGDAIEVVKEINSKLNEEVFTLDIYGKIDSNQISWFNNLQTSFPHYISYKGCVDFNKSVDTIKEYFALLFPTYYQGEGFAGTIIDAFAAGVPIIATDWKYNEEIVENGVCGYIYPTQDNNALYGILRDIVDDPTKITKLKKNCINKAIDYMPHKAIQVIVDNLID